MSSPDINPFPAFSSVPEGRARLRHPTLGVHDLRKVLDKSRTKELFRDIPVDEKEIKRLPRKLRPYYESLSTIHDHYQEVDSLLSSGLPNAIATSFKPAQSTYSQFLDTWEQDEYRYHPGARRTTSARGRASVHEDEGEDGRAEGEGEDEELLPSSAQKEEARDKTARFALNVNFVINIILLASKGLAVLSSSSISLVASFVDSALDFLSTLIILGTSLAMGRKSERHHYPVGKRRFEPLGVLIFSVAMIASFFQVFIESFQRTIHPSKGEIAQLSWIGIGTMVGTIVIKGVVWFWCSRMPSTAVRALAQDAENDVIFNAMSLAFPFIGAKLGWRLLDPIGGMVLSSYIIFEWCKTLYENFVNLSGKGASPDEITRVLYLCTRLRPVREISSVECYHVGDELIVEVDIILPVTSSLHYAHDVAETAQCLIEGLDHVARAYVHCDYSSENPSQHTARNGPKKSPRGSAHQSDEQVVQSPPPINGDEQAGPDYMNSKKQEIRLDDA